MENLSRRLMRVLPVATAVLIGACASESPEPAARRVAAVIAAPDFGALAGLAHPEKGIRFSPYSRVDTATDRRLSREQIRVLSTSPDSLLWGSYDGSGEPIRLTFRQYFAKFVRDFDLLAAPRVAVDSAPMGTGNSINNIREAYPGARIVEFNTPGTDPRYGGMDWRSLWIVLERSGPRWYVVGLVHGSWTI
jgi:hypothetical protein